MAVSVTRVGGTHRLDGDAGLVEIGNRWLVHLEARNYSAATVRGYAFDLVSLGRFCDESGIVWDELVPSDVFDWLEWQARSASTAGERVVPIGVSRGAAPSTMNRRVAAARGLFEYAVMCGLVDQNPVPSPRRSSGLRARRSGRLGHAAGRRTPGPARLVRQDRPLPETVEAADIEVFLADLNTHRDRAVTLAMLLGGLRAGEVRSLRLAGVDMGMRQVTVVGKGNKTRVVPIDRPFFTEVRAYLDKERPRGLSTPECFIVLRGPTKGQAMTEAGLRKIFRTHRARTGAIRVRPHRLRHTFGTGFNAGMSLPALMALLGHVTPEMTLRYAKVASPTIRDAYDTAMAKVRGRRPLYVIPPGATTTVPAKVDWLHDEMLKTRLAHGFCSRDPIAGPCGYANVCEQCDNFVPDPTRADVLEHQLADIHVLRDDAEARGWTDETARQDRVAAALDRHLRRLNRKPAND